ncbi:MAG TPA: hypothetical protein VHO24_19870, partial [Opitutaceae bacterium]|nr:hypothetical protein [Opitutaceae bacterium]
MTILSRLVIALCCLFCTALHAGNLKVNLAPSQAVSAGAQWRVDGGTWRNSGTTVNGLSNANHTVDFKAVSGWVAPASMTVAVVSGTTTKTGTYVQTASLKITLTPSSGQWRIDGGAWRTSGTTVSGLTPGNHAVDYTGVSGFAAPSAETVTLTAGQTTTLARNYTQLAQLKVTLSPTSAQWRVDGGAWQASGATVANLAVGSHTINYSAVSGYTAPATESVTLGAGQLLTLTRSYVQLAQLSITLTPTSAQWRVDGGAWNASGATVTHLAVGAHTVDYAALAGYNAPPSESVSLASGQSLSLSRSYVQLAQLTVTLSASNAQWRVDGGVWQASGATVSNLAVGNHAVEYTAYPEYINPPAETVALAAGQSLSLSRTYTQKASVRLTLVPNTGQWRIPGGDWNASDVTVWVVPGTYTLEFSPLAFYDPPPFPPVTLVSAGSLSGPVEYQSTKPTLQVQLVPNTGQWRVDGGAWQASGAVVSFLDEGSHTVDFSDLGGDYNPLPSETISLALRQHASMWKEYPIKPASVTVNLTPASATWRIFPGTTPFGLWQNAGATVTGLAPGSYSIEYASVLNHDPLAIETIALTPGQSLALDRNYTPRASFNVSLTPAQAQWRLDGGAWQSTTTILNDLSVGIHTVDFSTVDGYLTPASETVTLVAGANPPLTRSYIQLASLYVSLPPLPPAQWRLDGGAWQSFPSSLSNLSLGIHTVEFSAVEGYITPASQTVTLVSGPNSLMGPTYVPLASLYVSLALPAAQWRLDGGAWQSFPTALNNLSLGIHTVEFSPVEGYITPASQTVTLVSGPNSLMGPTYVPLASLY